jgi:hypothetical protein
VRLNWKTFQLALLASLVALAGAGCSGVNASQSVSPIDFLLPGAGHILKADPATTNTPGILPENSIVIATVR